MDRIWINVQSVKFVPRTPLLIYSLLSLSNFLNKFFICEQKVKGLVKIKVSYPLEVRIWS